MKNLIIMLTFLLAFYSVESQNATLRVQLNTTNPADVNELIYSGEATLSSCGPDRYSKI